MERPLKLMAAGSKCLSGGTQVRTQLVRPLPELGKKTKNLPERYSSMEDFSRAHRKPKITIVT